MMEKEIECIQVETKKSGSFSTMVKGILLGGLLGAGITLLSAPRSGMETRTMLREKSIELKDKAVDTAQQTMDRANEMTGRGKSQVNQRLSGLKSTVEGVKQGIRTYQEEGGTSISSTLREDWRTESADQPLSNTDWDQNRPDGSITGL